MAQLAGKHALLQMFQAEGVKYIFGNPGTSETPMMSILPEYPDLDYILVLQEGVAVGMAEGYARTTGTVPLVSLHIDNGLANAYSMMIDQLRSGTPMVITSGNKDVRKLGPGRQVARHSIKECPNHFFKLFATILNVKLMQVSTHIQTARRNSNLNAVSVRDRYTILSR